jgi:hypothetical protein
VSQIEIVLNVKSSSKRKKFIDSQLIMVNQIHNINELITNLVSENVDAYNQKKTDQPLFQYLTQKEIEDTLHTGKIGFDDRKNEKQQDKEEAVKMALLAFKDGIIRVFIDEEEIEYNCTYSLKPHANVIFIKMVMLAGRMW